MNDPIQSSIPVPRKLLAAIVPNHRALCAEMWERYLPASIRVDVRKQRPQFVADWLDEFARLCKRAEKLGYGAECGTIALADQHNFYVRVWSEPKKRAVLVASFVKRGAPQTWSEWATFAPHSRSAVLQLYRDWSMTPGSFPSLNDALREVGPTNRPMR